MVRNLQALFDANPPKLPSDLEALFCNRKDELQWAVEQLRVGDVDRILAIHGTWRSGKSHFARRLLLEIERERLPYRCIAVNAFNRVSARAVLREVYFRFVELLDKTEHTRPEHEAEFQRIRALKPLVDQDRAERTSEASRRGAVAVEQSESVGGGVPNVVSGTVALKGQWQREDAARMSEKQVSLSDRDVVAVLEAAARLLRTDDQLPRVLLLVDDLDLVDAEGVEGAAPSIDLMDLLRPLAEHRDVVVVATTRHAFVDGRKNVVYDLAELGPLQDDDLRSAYSRRIARFHEGVPIFDAEALSELIASAQGMVGVFVRNCYEVYRRAGMSTPLPLGQRAIDDYARWKLDGWLRDRHHVEAVVAVTRAARMGQTELTLTPNLRESALHLSLLLPTVNGSDVWAINPLFARALRGARATTP